jgi:hypothetical protein
MSNSNPATTTEHKLTAEQVTNDCPDELQDLGKRIKTHLDKAAQAQDKADQHRISAGQLLATANKACDDGGFDAFRERFCPGLRKSRAYELLTIATEKKSVDEIRANTRARVEKHRANKAKLSVTVTDKPDPSERQGAPSEVAPADSPSIVPQQTPEPAKPRGEVTPKDERCFEFTTLIEELKRRTKKQKVERFAKTAVEADDLVKLGQFLIDLAKLKKASSVNGNDSVSPEQSAEDMKAKHAGREK